MNYQPRNNHNLSHTSNNRGRNNHLRIVVKIIVGIAVVLVLFDVFAPRALPYFFSRIFSPLWSITQRSHDNQISILQQQLEALSATSASIALLVQENTELKTLLGRPPTKNTILAVVLKKPPFAAYDNLIIDLGSNTTTAGHTIAVGDMVYAVSPAFVATTTNTASTTASTTSVAATIVASTSVTTVETSVKVPIGTISEVDANTSKVSLFSTPGQNYNVEVGTKHLPLTATGRGSGSFEATVPREAGVAIGDIVIIPSIEPIAFATVAGMVSEPARPYATLLFQSPVNVFALHWVEVDTTTVK